MTIALAIALVVGFLAAALRIFREYERGVMFTLGRYTGVMGPGLVIMIPVIQRMVRVDLRTRVLDVPPQDLITSDNVSVRVSAVLYFRVLSAEKAIIQVENFMAATSQFAQTTLRAVLGQHDLDELIAERDRLNVDLQRILDEQTESWGIKVANVEIKQVDVDETMMRAIARQAEAERNRRAKVIEAQGEQQAADEFLHAATILSNNPQAMHVRYLNAIGSVVGDRTRLVVFPLPTGMLGALASWGRERADRRRTGGEQRKRED